MSVNGVGGIVNQALKENRKGNEYIEANGEVIAKRCCVCGEMKELVHFTNSKVSLGRTVSKCKLCLREHPKKYRKKKSEYDKRYYENNKKGTEAKKESDRRYYEKNKDKIVEYRKKRTCT